MYTLGIWDGHDSGAALIEGNSVIFAANEERFTKRKLEVHFPIHSINAALKYAGLKPSDVEKVAFTTTELTKTLERAFPYMKENYYQFRRRKQLRPRFENARHNLKYRMTSIGVVPFSTSISKGIVARNLRHMGFAKFKLDVVEHHTAHAAGAAFTSHMKNGAIITLDGVGDGICGSVNILENGEFTRKQSISVRDSIGIFYEQVTNVLGMREMEDEGKIMAMSCYSYPFPFEENKLRDFFIVTGTLIRAKYGPTKQFEMLQRIAWQTPREQFSYMAQQLIENVMAKYVSNVLDRYSMSDVAFAGGVFANVKANMCVRNLEQLRHWYVFPHMGDGGIALGSALYSSYLENGTTDYRFNAYLGNEYTKDETLAVLKKDRSLIFQEESPFDHTSHAAELLGMGNYLLWFQGRMEYGPRALGNRSIVARSDQEEVKDRLNLYVKKREWFQPFAPSVLEDDVGRIVEYDGKGLDKYMTMAYMVKKEMREHAKSVMHIDGSARPQMVGEENLIYMNLIRKVKGRMGNGIVMNTSFNIHGYPIVMEPGDAVGVLKATKSKYLFINGIFVTNRAGVY